MQYFSSFKKQTIPEKIPVTIATKGTISTPFSYTSPLIKFASAPAVPKML
jgi:hypothetical protein